jgi:hypothetical protein
MASGNMRGLPSVARFLARFARRLEEIGTADVIVFKGESIIVSRKSR